jgi:hypothetical protein
MPADGAREDLGFLEEFLDVVFAEVGLQRVRLLVQGEDVVGGLQLGDGDETDLD